MNVYKFRIVIQSLIISNIYLFFLSLQHVIMFPYVYLFTYIQILWAKPHIWEKILLFVDHIQRIIILLFIFYMLYLWEWIAITFLHPVPVSKWEYWKHSENHNNSLMSDAQKNAYNKSIKNYNTHESHYFNNLKFVNFFLCVLIFADI